MLAVVVVDYVISTRGPDSHFFFPANLQATDRSKAADQLFAQIPAQARGEHRIRPWCRICLTVNASLRLLARPLSPPDFRLREIRETNEGAPIYPFAAPDNWPPVYNEYQPVATAGPFELSKLKRSVTLEPLPEIEPQPKPIELAAYGVAGRRTSREPALSVRPGETARLMLAWRRQSPARS